MNENVLSYWIAHMLRTPFYQAGGTRFTRMQWFH